MFHERWKGVSPKWEGVSRGMWGRMSNLNRSVITKTDGEKGCVLGVLPKKGGLILSR